MNKVLILGNPRSGTSLLRLMLNGHPRIVAPPECGFLQWWHPKYNHWEANSRGSILDDFIDDLKQSRKIETWNLNFDELKRLTLANHPRNYGELCSMVYLQYSRQQGKSVDTIVDKNNYYIHHLHQLLEIWPDSFFIHLIRDGRDVACSYKAMANLKSLSPYLPLLPSDIRSITKEWKSNNNNIIDFLKMVSPSKIISLRYEDLVTNPKESLDEICNRLSLAYDDGMLHYFEAQSLNKEPLETMDWKIKTLQKPDPNNIYKYRKELTKGEIEVFNQEAADLLTLYNYPI